MRWVNTRRESTSAITSFLSASSLACTAGAGGGASCGAAARSDSTASGTVNDDPSRVHTNFRAARSQPRGKGFLLIGSRGPAKAGRYCLEVDGGAGGAAVAATFL